MIPAPKYLIDSMKQIRLGRMAFFFYPEQKAAILAQATQEGIDVDIRDIKPSWNGCIYKKRKKVVK